MNSVVQASSRFGGSPMSRCEAERTNGWAKIPADAMWEAMRNVDPKDLPKEARTAWALAWLSVEVDRRLVEDRRGHESYHDPTITEIRKVSALSYDGARNLLSEHLADVRKAHGLGIAHPPQKYRQATDKPPTDNSAPKHSGNTADRQATDKPPTELILKPTLAKGCRGSSDVQKESSPNGEERGDGSAAPTPPRKSKPKGDPRVKTVGDAISTAYSKTKGVPFPEEGRMRKAVSGYLHHGWEEDQIIAAFTAFLHDEEHFDKAHSWGSFVKQWLPAHVKKYKGRDNDHEARALKVDRQLLNEALKQQGSARRDPAKFLEAKAGRLQSTGGKVPPAGHALRRQWIAVEEMTKEAAR